MQCKLNIIMTYTKHTPIAYAHKAKTNLEFTLDYDQKNMLTIEILFQERSICKSNPCVPNWGVALGRLGGCWVRKAL